MKKNNALFIAKRARLRIPDKAEWIIQSLFVDYQTIPIAEAGRTHFLENPSR